MAKRKQNSFLLVALLVNSFVFGQTKGYKFYANIDSINASGFYSIVLDPLLTAKIKKDYSDLRIVNGQDRWIPHLIREYSYNPSIKETRIPFTLIKKEETFYSSLYIIEHNGPLSNIELNMQNTSAERYATLTGSDDQQKWYSINDSILIKPELTPAKTSSVFNLYFPECNYRFYRIEIYNNRKAPVKINTLSEKIPVKEEFNSPFYQPVENPPVKLKQKDSAGISYIRVMQPGAFHFTKVSLRVEGVKYYSRHGELIIAGHTTKEFDISNNSSLNVLLEDIVKASDFEIRIYNMDNPPLTVKEVKTYNNFSVATAFLEKGNKYRLILDNDSAATPDYDIHKIPDSLFNASAILHISKLYPMPELNSISKKEKRNIWLWPVIIIAILVLSFLSFKLVKDISGSKNN